MVVVVVVMVTHSDGVRALQGGVPPQKIQLRRQQGFPVYYTEAEQTELSLWTRTPSVTSSMTPVIIQYHPERAGQKLLHGSVTCLTCGGRRLRHLIGCSCRGCCCWRRAGDRS